MADTFTDSSRAIFAKKVLAHVASLGPDGAPHVTPCGSSSTGTTW